MVDALLTAVRRAPERVLRPLRHSAALQAVERRPLPDRILVVCHGNICRSPFAAAMLQRLLRDAGVTVESAGFIGPGRKPPADALAAAHRRGVNLSVHRSQLLTTQLVQRASLVVVMDTRQARALRERFGAHAHRVTLLGDFDSHGRAPRAIADPVDQSADIFDAVYARIERCAAALAVALARRARTE